MRTLGRSESDGPPGIPGPSTWLRPSYVFKTPSQLPADGRHWRMGWQRTNRGRRRPLVGPAGAGGTSGCGPVSQVEQRKLLVMESLQASNYFFGREFATALPFV